MTCYGPTPPNSPLAAALNDLGEYHCALGDHQWAVTRCRQALDLHRELGNRDGEADSLTALGRAYQALGRTADAIACHRSALSLLEELGQAYNQSTALTRLGDAYRTAGDLAAACQCWRQALTILDDLHHPDAAEIRARLDQARPSGRAESKRMSRRQVR